MNTINFLYFLYNFNREAVHKAFETTGLKDHFINKWIDHSTRKRNGTHGLLETIMEMSDDNKQKVIEWVEKNYDYRGKRSEV